MRRFPTVASLSASLVAVILLLWPSQAHSGDGLVVHEWGTFTSLQDETGRELAGINVDDEPVPDFVHNLSRYILSPTFMTSLHWRFRMKAVPRRHPLVSLRLETPVIYFYPPEGQTEPMTLDVAVQFRGGWLSEFYPDAEAQAPGIRWNKQHSQIFGQLTPETIGTLTWKGLRIGTQRAGPATKEHVWTAPRKVRSAAVTTPQGESEKYLFYRGVGNLRAPLRLVTNRESRSFFIRSNFDAVLASDSVVVPALWIVDIRADGAVAFRPFGPITVTADPQKLLAHVSYSFDEDDYSTDHLEKLRRDMHGALVKEGLYPDEATAMLSTWRRAYFTSPGRRVFHVVPRVWTDHYLPLEISKPARIERVMLGRIEMVTERQRELLAVLAPGPVSDGSWVKKIPKSTAREMFLAGRDGFGDLGVEIPPDYQTYLDIGRFRNAILADEERHRPTPSLTSFMNAYGLRPYRLEKGAVETVSRAR